MRERKGLKMNLETERLIIRNLVPECPAIIKL